MVMENGYLESDRTYVREIGQTVDQLIDQVNDLTDQQDQIGARLSKI